LRGREREEVILQSSHGGIVEKFAEKCL